MQYTQAGKGELMKDGMGYDQNGGSEDAGGYSMTGGQSENGGGMSYSMSAGKSNRGGGMDYDQANESGKIEQDFYSQNGRKKNS